MSKKQKILIVEDDQFIAKAYKFKIDAEGFTVLPASNGAEALTLLKKHEDVELILLDLIMPEMNGYEFLQKKGENAEWNDIPVIVLTNLGQQEDKELVANYGVEDFFVKADTSFKDMVALIKKTLK